MNKSTVRQNMERSGRYAIRWPVFLSIVFFDLVIILCGYLVYKNQKTTLTNSIKEDAKGVSLLKVRNVES